MDPYEQYFNASLAPVYKYLDLLSVSHLDAFKFMMLLRNLTTFTLSEIRQYTADYMQFKAINLVWWYTSLSIAVSCGFLGMIGYIIEAIILTDKEFKTPSFLYHKGLVVFEFVQSICYSAMYLVRLVDGFNEPYATIFNDIVIVDQMAAMTAIWIAVFMSGERMVALFYPTKFHKVNKKRYVIWAMFFSFFLSFHYFVDFWAPQLKPLPQYRSFTLYRENLITAECFLLAVMSIAVGLGLFVRGKQQLKLGKDVDQLAKERFQLNKQLCVLSISCSVPFFLEKLTYSVSFTLSPVVCPTTLGDVLLPTYTDAQRILDLNRISCQFYFVHVIVAGIAHNSHLYCYLLFSKRFQQAALKIYRKATGKVEPERLGSSHVGSGATAMHSMNVRGSMSTMSTMNSRLSVSTRHGSFAVKNTGF